MLGIRDPDDVNDPVRRRPRILIADDHKMVAEALARLLEPSCEILHIVTTSQQLIDKAREIQPDVILCDISMPDRSGISAISLLRENGVNAPVVYCTMHSEPGIVDAALKSGANGYVLKTAAADELVRAVNSILRGGLYVSPELLGHVLGRTAVPKLTNRQQMVLNLMAEGHRSKEIAFRLDLSVRTVEAHRQILMQIMSVRNSIELVRRAEELGLVSRSQKLPDTFK